MSAFICFLLCSICIVNGILQVGKCSMKEQTKAVQRHDLMVYIREYHIPMPRKKLCPQLGGTWNSLSSKCNRHKKPIKYPVDHLNVLLKTYAPPCESHHNDQLSCLAIKIGSHKLCEWKAQKIYKQIFKTRKHFIEQNEKVPNHLEALECYTVTDDSVLNMEMVFNSKQPVLKTVSANTPSKPAKQASQTKGYKLPIKPKEEVPYDSRQLMDDKNPVWKMVGQVMVENYGPCSAALISRNIILAAAHCFVHNIFGGFKGGSAVLDIPQKMAFIENWSQDDADRKFARLERLYIPVGYMISSEANTPQQGHDLAQYDYAIGVLPNDVDYTEYFSFGFNTDAHFKDVKSIFFNAGYADQSLNWKTRRISLSPHSFASENNIDPQTLLVTQLVESNLLQDITRISSHGESGSSLFYYDETSETNIINGVLSGLCFEARGPPSRGTRFTRITKYRYKLITTLIDEIHSKAHSDDASIVDYLYLSMEMLSIGVALVFVFASFVCGIFFGYMVYVAQQKIRYFIEISK